MTRALTVYRAVARASALLPAGVGAEAAQWAGMLAASLPDHDGRRAVAASHMARVLGRPLRPRERRGMTRELYANYARYWAESLRLPAMAPAEVTRSTVVVGEEHLDAALAEGRGAVIVTPHLGGWEWGALYLIGRGFAVTVAVEPLHPPDVFEWFVGFREALGMQVVAVGHGGGAGVALLRALRERRVVCLLADRLVAGAAGVDVQFFDAKLKLPAGPVALALRAGAPLLAGAVYFGRKAGEHTVVVRPRLRLAEGPRFRDAVATGAQAVAGELEALVRAAPAQWHVVQPMWPGDPELRDWRAWSRDVLRALPGRGSRD